MQETREMLRHTVQTAKASRKQSSLSGKESAQGCIPKRLHKSILQLSALPERVSALFLLVPLCGTLTLHYIHFVLGGSIHNCWKRVEEFCKWACCSHLVFADPEVHIPLENLQQFPVHTQPLNGGQPSCAQHR